MNRRGSHIPRTTVLVRDREVVKESPLDPAAEFAKAAALAAVGRSCGFVAPAPLACDGRAGTVTYERVDLGPALGHLVGSDHDAAKAAVRSAGRALADIHTELHVKAAPLEALPRPLVRFLSPAVRQDLEDDARRGPVVGHGDFAVWNVFLGPHGDDLVVLDCAPNGYSSVRPVVCESRYVDLALFDSCLLGRAGLRSYAHIRRGALAPLRRAFAEAYQERAGVELDRRTLDATTRAVLAAYFHDRRRWSPRVARTVAAVVSRRQAEHRR